MEKLKKGKTFTYTYSAKEEKPIAKKTLTKDDIREIEKIKQTYLNKTIRKK